MDASASGNATDNSWQSPPMEVCQPGRLTRKGHLNLSDLQVPEEEPEKCGEKRLAPEPSQPAKRRAVEHQSLPREEVRVDTPESESWVL